MHRPRALDPPPRHYIAACLFPAYGHDCIIFIQIKVLKLIGIEVYGRIIRSPEVAITIMCPYACRLVSLRFSLTFCSQSDFELYRLCLGNTFDTLRYSRDRFWDSAATHTRTMLESSSVNFLTLNVRWVTNQRMKEGVQLPWKLSALHERVQRQ